MGILLDALFELRSLQWKIANYLNRKNISFRCRGFRWSVLGGDSYVSRMLFTFGEWQFKEIQIVSDWLRAGGSILKQRDIIINVGAFIGSTALFLNRTSGCRILAIEPVPEFFKLLLKNIRQNNLEGKISTFSGAVFDPPRELLMRVPPGNPGSSEVCTESSVPPSPGDDVVKVSGLPLELILEQQKIDKSRIALVWSDTQGCEGHVIRSGAELWENGVPLVMEFWPDGIIKQEKESIIPLIQKYFSSFAILPHSHEDELRIKELPIDSLNDSITDEDDEVDLLLIPRSNGPRQ